MIIDFAKNITLENDFVLLRPLAITDLDVLLVFSVNEPELWEYSLTPANGKENLRNYINKALEERNQNRSYPFVVMDKLTGMVAGSTRFYDYQALHNTVLLGYTWYGKKYQGTGINKNCKFLLLSHAFEKWKLDRVEFRADNNNKRSISAMKSIGGSLEGVLRSNYSTPAGRRDSIVYSILKDEWFDGKKSELERKIQNATH